MNIVKRHLERIEEEETLICLKKLRIFSHTHLPVLGMKRNLSIEIPFPKRRMTEIIQLNTMPAEFPLTLLKRQQPTAPSWEDRYTLSTALSENARIWESMPLHMQMTRSSRAENEYCSDLTPFITQVCFLPVNIADSLSAHGMELRHLHGVAVEDLIEIVRDSLNAEKILLAHLHVTRAFARVQPRDLSDFIHNFCWFSQGRNQQKPEIISRLRDELVSLDTIPRLTDSDFIEGLGLQDPYIVRKIRLAYISCML